MRISAYAVAAANKKRRSFIFVEDIKTVANKNGGHSYSLEIQTKTAANKNGGHSYLLRI